MLRRCERIALIGCGGIGSWLLPPLLRFLHAERYGGEIHLWDGDRFNAGNALRQAFGPEALGTNKAEAQAEAFQALFPALRLVARAAYVSVTNIAQAVPGGSAVLVAVDNHPARALVARQAELLREVCVLSAGNELLDGNVHVTLRRGGQALTAPLLDRHPEIAASRRGDRAQAGCAELIERGQTQFLVTNFLAAAALFAAFHTLWTHGERHGRRKAAAIPQELYFDTGSCAMSALFAARR